MSTQDYFQDETEKIEECEKLDSLRANFTDCCFYPTLVIDEESHNYCKNICAPRGFVSNPCCIPECCYTKLGIIYKSSSSRYNNINPDRISYSFLLSVNDDIGWEPVVNQSVQRCYDEIENNPVETMHGTCMKIPSTLSEIVDCAYKENFLRCPRWNQKLKECVFTYKYVVNDC